MDLFDVGAGIGRECPDQGLGDREVHVKALQEEFRSDDFDPWQVIEDLYDPETGLPR